MMPPANRLAFESPTRVAIFAFVLAVSVTLLALLAHIAAQPGDPWNANRLAPAVAWWRGYSLYYPMDSGPVLSTVVGPTAFLFYVPIAWLPLGPTKLILVASTWNLLWLAGLAWYVLRGCDRRGALLGALLIGNLALHFPSLRYSIFCVHADAPALLLGGLGIAVLMGGDRAGSPLSLRRRIVSALLLSLGIWAKQSMAPLLGAALLVVALRQGVRPAARFLGTALAVGAVVSIAFIIWFGGRTLWDNMFVVPSQHPWMQVDPVTGEAYSHLAAVGVLMRLKVLLAAALAIIREHWLLLAGLGAAVIWNLRERNWTLFRERRWPSYFLCALALFPTAVIGRVKIGGELNHFSFVVFFLVLAGVVAVLEAPATTVLNAGRRLTAAALTVLVLVNAPLAANARNLASVHDNQNEHAFRYALTQPGRVYFPWNTLSTLLAEGRLYHFDYGVFDRNLGGAIVTPGHIASALPGARPVIASWIAHHDHILRRYFPDYIALPPEPALPDWRFYGPPDLRAQ